ncbi:MAG: ribosome maturation factor RimM [Chitinophagales bacterium]|nr:ribosome maturation factor RimM [Chitinophagales bacterium]
MEEPSLIKAGKLNKTFGLKGHIRFFMDPEIADRIKKLDTIFVMHQKKPLPFFVDELDLTESGHGMIHFEDVKDKTAADELVGREFFVDEKKLKKKKPFTSFADFIGFELIDENRGLVGVLDDVLQLPQHELGRFLFNGKEVLFPWNEEVVRKIDKRKKEISVRLPEGLLEVYL